MGNAKNKGKQEDTLSWASPCSEAFSDQTIRKMPFLFHSRFAMEGLLSAASATRNPSRTDLVVKPSKKLLMGTQCWAQGERSTAATRLFTWPRCPGCISSWSYQPSWSPTALSDPVYIASVPSSQRQICCTSPCCCSFSLTSQNRDKNNMKTAWTLHSCCCHILFP